MFQIIIGFEILYRVASMIVVKLNELHKKISDKGEANKWLY